MFYHNNDYLVPVLIGGSREKTRMGRIILKTKRAVPHIFWHSHHLVDKLFFKCHFFKPNNDFWLFTSLVSFAEGIEEYYTPALIISGEDDERFIEKYVDELEKYFVVIKFEDYISENK